MKSRGGDSREPQIELFRIELVRLLDMDHPMVKLAQHIDWDGFESPLLPWWYRGFLLPSWSQAPRCVQI